MRQTPHRIFLLLLTALVAVANGVWLLPPLERRIERGETRRTRRGMERIDEARDARVLVFGNSRMNKAIDPAPLEEALRRRTGEPWPVAEFSFGGATPASNRVILERLLQLTPPRPDAVAIVGLTELDLCASFPGTQNALRYLYGPEELPWVVRNGGARSGVELLSYHLFPLYRFRLQIKDAARGLPEGLEGGAGAPGFGIDASSVDPSQSKGLKRYRDEWLAPFEIRPLEIRALEEMLDVADRSGIGVLLVRLPAGRPLRTLSRERVDPLLVPVIERLLAERPFVRFLDWSGDEAAGRYTYYDCAHLADESVGAFCGALAEEITRE